MTNLELLNYRGSLPVNDIFRQFVMQILAERNPCPRCQTRISYLECVGVDINELDLHAGASLPCTCPSCGVKLFRIIPEHSNGHWAIVLTAAELRDE